MTAKYEVVGANVGEYINIQFSLSSFLLAQSLLIQFWFIPECQCTGAVSPYTFSCDNVESSIVVADVEIGVICSAARINVTISNVSQEAFGEYIVSVSTTETDGDMALTKLTLVSL